MHFPFSLPEGVDLLPSPGLLLWETGIRRNLSEMLRIAGGPARLWPHLKTHKTTEIVQMQVQAGIVQAKAATLAEAELAAQHGVRQVLLAYPPVGPNVARLGRLQALFPQTCFSVLVDSSTPLKPLNGLASGEKLSLFVDVNTGMNRTGTAPGPGLRAFVHFLQKQPRLHLRGLHVYDGHLRGADPTERRQQAEAGLQKVQEILPEIFENEAFTIIAGGSPTLAAHAQNPRLHLSPGTTWLWDAGYAEAFPDLPFTVAAALLTRVIAKPAADLLTLDLGHKAVAAENPPDRRFRLPALPDAVPIGHSEEHAVVRTEEAARFSIGEPLLAVPFHICPSVALHDFATVISSENKIIGNWNIQARSRRLSFENQPPCFSN